MFHTIVSIKNDGHYFCRAGGNRPDGLNEPVTEKRRRRTTQEKIAIVQQSFEPGMTVSLVARQHGVAASQLFLWRKQYQEGSLTAVAAGEQVVPASELAAAMKQIKELQRLLGKKTMENELLKEAVEYGRAKKWIAHAPLLPGDGE